MRLSLVTPAQIRRVMSNSGPFQKIVDCYRAKRDATEHISNQSGLDLTWICRVRRVTMSILKEFGIQAPNAFDQSVRTLMLHSPPIVLGADYTCAPLSI